MMPRRACPVALTLIAGAIAVLFGVVAVPVCADAKGTVRVQQSNGSVEMYKDVTIKLVRNKAIYVTTADHKGTLIIDQAACSYVGEIRRCLPYSAKLEQDGKTRPLDFKDGTIYGNLTDKMLTLPLSSQQVPPKGIVMLFKTRIGTFVSVTGTMDEVTE
jgi:hypothetical protein